MIEIRSRWGPALADTGERMDHILRLRRLLSQYGYRYEDFFYTDHIGYQPQTDQYILTFRDRIVTLSEHETGEEPLEIEESHAESSGCNP